MTDQVSFIPLGGIGDVTRNMYLYEYQDQILIVDCGLGFPDETMIGVDLLLPDISYLLQTKRKIAGMLLTHGHEDHIGALPFLLPQLPKFPVYATPFTASLANEKLKDFGLSQIVQTVFFDKPRVSLGAFSAEFIHVTHSVPDTSHIFIQTPVGNFYHGSDFKFDETPYSGKVTDYEKIKQVGQKGVLCLLSDCLGAEKKGRTKSEIDIIQEFEQEMARCRGKFIVTTFSSHIARINQVIDAAKKNERKVCFVGRSLVKAKEVARRLGYLQLDPHMDLELSDIHNYTDDQLVFIIAGSQGQENSGMVRVVNGEHKDVKLGPSDTVVFSSDPIPGSEVSVFELIDSLARKDVRVIYTDINENLHVSGHGSAEELSALIDLTKPKKLIPIGGNFRHMAAYRMLAQDKGYSRKDILLLEDGEEVVFTPKDTRFDRTLPIKLVYVDEISGEEMEHFVFRDRQKLSEGGIIIVVCEIDATTGQLVEKPEIVTRGFVTETSQKIVKKIFQDLTLALASKKGRVTNWVYVRKMIENIAERRIFKELRRRPLVLPVVIEV